MPTSPTTVYGIIGAVGTGLAALGTSLAAVGSMAGAPSWLPITAACLGAVGGAIAVTAKVLGGIATADAPKQVSK
jgi:hypothetical protein